MLLTGRNTLASELHAVMAVKGATEWSKILDVDRTTVHKWWAGEAYPRGRQLEAIATELGRRLRFVTDEDGAEDEAATLLRLWTGVEPPPWARTLTDEITAAVRDLRQEALEEGARQRLDELTARLEQRLRGERTREA